MESGCFFEPWMRWWSPVGSSDPGCDSGVRFVSSNPGCVS